MTMRTLAMPYPPSPPKDSSICVSYKNAGEQGLF